MVTKGGRGESRGLHLRALVMVMHGMDGLGYELDLEGIENLPHAEGAG